jgi:hypothetical protein
VCPAVLMTGVGVVPSRLAGLKVTKPSFIAWLSFPTDTTIGSCGDAIPDFLGSSHVQLRHFCLIPRMGVSSCVNAFSW